MDQARSGAAVKDARFWRAASAVMILDGCESGGHYIAILVGSCPWLGIAVCCVTSRLRSRHNSCERRRARRCVRQLLRYNTIA